MRWSAILSCLLAIGTAADPVPPSLARVKEKVLQDLRRLPNCTCTETIERSYRFPWKGAFARGDRLQVEVGYVNGEELYSRPGGKALSASDLSRLVSGTISTGDFVITVSNLFKSASATFVATGAEVHGGRMALRYDFRVPARLSYWIVRMEEIEAEVGYHGSFWVARDSLDLIEVKFSSDDIPKPVGFGTLERTMQYERVPVGQSNLLLPSRVVMLAIDREGQETKVEIQFRNCHEYVVETLLHFGEDIAPESAATRFETPPEPPPEIIPSPELKVPKEAVAEEPVARQALNQAAQRAAKYIKQLPDFLCVQTTRTHLDAAGNQTWKQGRTATHHLRYVAGQEQYSEETNGRQGLQQQKAVLSSTGEFASLLKTVFAPAVRASFQWKGTEVVDGEPLFVYSFRADRSRARYWLSWGSYPKQVAAVGFEGVINIDQQSSNPRRLEIRATELPVGFPMHDASLSVRYGTITLGGHPYLLPVRAVTTCSFGKHNSRLKNEIEFSEYRKYSVESKIGFEP
jgi:hypothetical protein